MENSGGGLPLVDGGRQYPGADEHRGFSGGDGMKDLIIDCFAGGGAVRRNDDGKAIR